MIKPPFTEQTALERVKLAQDNWNNKDPEKIIQNCSIDSKWRNKTAFFEGRDAIVRFLKRKWEKELDYALEKELWAFSDNRISVRFEYEWRDAETGQWYRTHGNEHLEFDEDGLLSKRDASANDIPILESERRILNKK